MSMTTILASVGGLVATTNVVVEVLKKVTSSVIPTSALAVIVSLFLTLTYGCAYLTSNAIGITWISIASLFVAGFLVSYAAMFGFDKLQEVLRWYDDDNTKGA